MGDLVFRHRLFFKSEEIQQFISQRRLIDVLTPILGPDLWVRWDQAIYKGPGGGEFPWHQDNAYNRLKDEHLQVWVALTKMDRDRGGLWLQEGSHRYGVVPHEVVGTHLSYPDKLGKAVAIEAEPGDLVLFSSLMLHSTGPNVTQDSRLAYVIEYMSMDSYDPYIRSPYFLAARNGEPHPEFVRFFRGRLSPANQLKYLIPRLRHGALAARRKVGAIIRGR